VLEAKPGESLAGGSLGAPITAPPPGSPLGRQAAQLGALPRDKLIDVIKHLVADRSAAVPVDPDPAGPTGPQARRWTVTASRTAADRGTLNLAPQL